MGAAGRAAAARRPRPRGDADVPKARRRRARTCARGALETPLDHFRGIRKKFDAAGISIYAYNYSFNDELHRRGDRPRLRDDARRSAPRSSPRRPRSTVAKRVVPFAEKHQMVVAMHNHSNTDGPERVRHARELRRGDGDVEVLQGQPRHRPLHGRELDAVAYLASTTPTSPTCTSRTARRTRATTCRGARATRRSARCCSC